MGVLHVVDGVVGGLLARQLDVEVERLVGVAAQEEVARGVGAHLVEQVLERDHLAGTLAHAHGLAAAEQVDELPDDDVELAGVAERRDGGLHART